MSFLFSLVSYLAACVVGFVFLVAGMEPHNDFIHVSPLAFLLVLIITCSPMWLFALLPLYAFAHPPMFLSRWYVWLFVGVACGLVGSLIAGHGTERLLTGPADERRPFFAPLVVGSTMFLPALLFRRLTDATVA